MAASARGETRATVGVGAGGRERLRASHSAPRSRGTKPRDRPHQRNRHRGAVCRRRRRRVPCQARCGGRVATGSTPSSVTASTRSAGAASKSAQAAADSAVARGARSPGRAAQRRWPMLMLTHREQVADVCGTETGRPTHTATTSPPTELSQPAGAHTDVAAAAAAYHGSALGEDAGINMGCGASWREETVEIEEVEGGRADAVTMCTTGASLLRHEDSTPAEGDCGGHDAGRHTLVPSTMHSTRTTDASGSTADRVARGCASMRTTLLLGAMCAVATTQGATAAAARCFSARAAARAAA